MGGRRPGQTGRVRTQWIRPVVEQHPQPPPGTMGKQSGRLGDQLQASPDLIPSTGAALAFARYRETESFPAFPSAAGYAAWPWEPPALLAVPASRPETAVPASPRETAAPASRQESPEASSARASPAWVRATVSVPTAVPFPAEAAARAARRAAVQPAEPVRHSRAMLRHEPEPSPASGPRVEHPHSRFSTA